MRMLGMIIHPSLLSNKCAASILSYTTSAQSFYYCGSHHSAGMHLLRPPGVLFIIILLMVSCGALCCSWTKQTDFRGLEKHRTTCKYYHKESRLAAEKRRVRARESSSQNLTSHLRINAASNHCNVTPVSHYSTYF